MIAAESYNQAISNNKLLVRLIGFLAIIIAGLAIAIALLFPLKSTKVELYEFSTSSHSFKKISSSDEILNLQKQLVNLYMHQYVINREVADGVNADLMLDWVRFNSSDKVFSEYQDLNTKVVKYLGVKGKREIEIETSYPFNGDYANYIYVVEFRLNDKRNKQTSTLYYKVLIKYEVLHEHLTKLDKLHLNPLGIKIIGYSLYKRNIKQ